MRIILHYNVDDVTCDGEYCNVDVEIDGRVVMEYGSDLEERGFERAESFIEGYVEATGLKYKISVAKINDIDE